VIRNFLVLVLSVAAFVGLYVGYMRLLAAPEGEADTERDTTTATLPMNVAESDGEPVRVEARALVAELPPGGPMEFTRYDKRTGRATEWIEFSSWRKVPDSTNELLVEQPRLTMLLPSGMTLTISARQGQVAAESMRSQDARPKYGWLEGDVRIVLDRASGEDLPPLEERPEDVVTIEMDRVAFDLEVGELRSEGPLHAVAREFDLHGRDLHLVWNRAENRIEKLVLAGGGNVEFQMSALGGVGEPEEPATASAPASAPAEPPRPRRPAPIYHCRITGPFAADQLRDGVRVGGITADAVSLRFAGGVGAVAGEQATPDDEAPTSAPASAPGTQPAERLHVRWDGPLELTPEEELTTEPVRVFEATGAVVLESGDRSVRCGRVEFDDSTGRVWIQRGEQAFVEIRAGAGLLARAASVFADAESDRVKLVGDVRLAALDRSAPWRGPRMTISCADWAELDLAAPADEPAAAPAAVGPADVLGSRALRTASFHGDVRIAFGSRRLRASSIVARFAPGAGAGSTDLNKTIEHAEARGNVFLEMYPETPLPEWLAEIARPTEIVVRAVVAPAAAPTAEQSLACAWMEVEFAAAEDGERFARHVRAQGSVDLRDAGRSLRAAGNALEAWIARDNAFERAVIRGVERGTPALVYARPYAVRGGEIHINEVEQLLRVDGPSTLRFRTQRGLRGLESLANSVVTVTAQKSLHVNGRGAAGDGSQSVVQFTGDVVATSGTERLECDSLSLLLADVDAAAPAARGAESPRGLRARKELSQVTALQARVTSAIRIPGDEWPLVEQAMSAPELRIDARNRTVRTHGQTRLTMLDRRVPSANTSVSRSPGLALGTAMMSSGPHQTVVQCDRAMTYAFGAEGPSRRDDVLFEGAVVFRHVAGKEMFEFERLLPSLASDPQRLAQVPSRNVTLRCQSLSATFTAEPAPASAPSAAEARPQLALANLNAAGDVWLRDQQDVESREVDAAQIEFDRGASVIHVVGGGDGRPAEARVAVENRVTGTISTPVVARTITIDLRTNTVRASGTTGRLRSP